MSDEHDEGNLMQDILLNSVIFITNDAIFLLQNFLLGLSEAVLKNISK